MAPVPTTGHNPTYLINIPPKIWQPKPINRFTLSDHNPNNVDKDLYLLPSYGHRALLCHPAQPLDFAICRNDVILWDAAKHQEEFNRVITIPSTLDSDTRNCLTDIIHHYWDSFIACGVS